MVVLVSLLPRLFGFLWLALSQCSERFDEFRETALRKLNTSPVDGQQDIDFYGSAQEAGVFEGSQVVDECPEALLVALAVFIADQYPVTEALESFVAHAEDFEVTNDNYLRLLSYYLLPALMRAPERVLDGWSKWHVAEGVRRLQQIAVTLDDFILSAYSIHEVTVYDEILSRATKFDQQGWQQVVDLSLAEESVYSQNGEDGVIRAAAEALADLPQFVGKERYFVEIGVGNGIQCNTRALRLAAWRGVMFDKFRRNPYVNLYREFISAENVNDVLRRYSVKQDIALLSIDIDGNDFYVWSALKYLRSILVMVEINGSLGADDKVIPYDSEFVSDGTTHYGASLPAMVALARLKGYVLIWANKINALFVKEAYEHRFAHAGDVNFWIQLDDGHPADPHDRPFISSEEALRMWHGEIELS